MSNAGSGGWRPSLVRESLGVTAESSFLASEHMMVKRSGITLDSSTVGADENGDKILRRGTVLGKIDANGKYRAYLNSLGDTVGGVAELFLLETVNLRHGDVVTGALEHGSVLAARCSGLDSAARTDLAGRIVFQ